MKLARQARAKAAEFMRRVPRHPDPEGVLHLSTATFAGQDRGDLWSMLASAGFALAIGGALGFWGIPTEGKWVWWAAGPAVLFSGFLKDATL
jgi:hypothetical protein